MKVVYGLKIKTGVVAEESRERDKEGQKKGRIKRSSPGRRKEVIEQKLTCATTHLYKRSAETEDGFKSRTSRELHVIFYNTSPRANIRPEEEVQVYLLLNK